MFYSVNLHKKGKFGTIWFLGSNTEKKLARKDIDKVVVRQSCSDISDLLPVRLNSLSLILNADFIIFSHFEQCFMKAQFEYEGPKMPLFYPGSREFSGKPSYPPPN
jgi:hypothetical protein